MIACFNLTVQGNVNVFRDNYIYIVFDKSQQNGLFCQISIKDNRLNLHEVLLLKAFLTKKIYAVVKFLSLNGK